MESRARPLLILAASVICMAGCGLREWVRNGYEVGPDYCRPAAAVSDDWIDADDERVILTQPIAPEWWFVLRDPVVNELVQTAYDQNLTLRQAGTRIMQARASRNIAAGNLFPQVQQAFGDYTRLQESESVALPAPLRSFDQWDVGFNASWEIDFWGRFRRAIESADAQLDSSVKDYDAVLVSLIAEVVSAYVDIRVFELRLQYAKENVKIQENSLEISTAIYEEDEGSPLGVYLASANLNATKSTVPTLRAGLRQSNNRLCTLLGVPPSDLESWIGVGDGLPKVPAEIAVGIPADLLRRRPDVVAAERLVAAQSAQIGIAVADLYPSISVVGEISHSSEQFSDLFNSASAAGFIGPGFRWNVLNYGRIQNNVRLQNARLLELIAAYQNTVLQANQEVEDALVAFLEAQKQVKLLQANVDDLQKSLDVLLEKFKQGQISFSPVFVLQGSLRGAQDRLAVAQGQVLLSMIAIYRALGGGWQIRCPGYQPQTMPSFDQLPSPADAMQGSDSEEFQQLLLLPESFDQEETDG